MSPSLTIAEAKNSYQTTQKPQLIEVLVDCPGIQGLYTYRLPPGMTSQPGDIVSIPFGSQTTGGIVIRMSTTLPTGLSLEQIKPVEEVIAEGFFAAEYWQVLEQVSQYYCTDLLTVIRTALPPGLLGRSQRRLRLRRDELPPGAETFLSPTAREVLKLLEGQKEGDYSLQYLQRQVRGAERGVRELVKKNWVSSYLEAPRTVKVKQQKAVILVSPPLIEELNATEKRVLKQLESSGGEVWLSELKVGTAALTQLVNQGYLVIENRERLRLQTGALTGQSQAKTLTQAQQSALEHIEKLQGYQQVLLHGVTGSGKTEVYLQAIASRLAEGNSVLVLVPEIGLTPQLTDRFLARFPGQVWVYHSGLSEGERYDTWRQMLLGEPQVIIGTRSAIFAPLPNIGMIILDEEHDTSFKQTQLAPTYHARRVAQYRAELANCPLILGSATPSSETWLAAKEQNTDYLALPERVASRPLPPVQVVDMREELKQGNRSIFSRSLSNALNNLGGKKAILFINRRGYSTFVSCRSCGSVLECPHCDVSLAYHFTEERGLLRCHYCNYGTLQPKQCPQCNSPYLKYFGSGTQRVVEELGEQFPQLRTIRFDSDTTNTKDAHRTLLSQFAEGDADVLVGTQMLTKGLDIKEVTLVGIIAADGLLYLSDYRASERAFQVLTQVAGRAGRGDDPGQVILQTYTPEHSVIKAVSGHDYESFIKTELTDRYNLGFPPYGELILLRLTGQNEAQIQLKAEELVEVIAAMSDCEILGPAPAGIPRVANRYRWQILLKFSQSEQKRALNWTRIRDVLGSSMISLLIDIDPISIA